MSHNVSIAFYIFTDPPIISTNRDWVHTGKKSTITLRCHVCAEKPYKVKLILFKAFHQHKTHRLDFNEYSNKMFYT